MPELVLLPSSAYQPPSPSQGRRAGRSLNTIIEEEPEESQRKLLTVPRGRGIQAHPSNEKIVQWLSPHSDHFPTPRGFHYMSAPILPDSPSTVSAAESNSPSITSSNPWNRASVCTDVTEFDDIYDVSDEEDTRRTTSRTSSLKRKNSSRGTMPKRPTVQPPSPHRALPPLVIPNQPEQNADSWLGRPELKKFLSPVPPTPPSKVDMSPAVISFLQSQQSLEVPTISAPPSLDGSLSSEQMAAMSAPPTPIIGAEEEATNTDWRGVQLQPAALATLQALSRGEDVEEGYQAEQVIEVGERRPEMTQQTQHLFATMARPALRLSTHQHQQSLNGLTRLDIPSPGGFFGGLTPRTRHTWHLPSMTPDDVAPPTSTTAEQFYRAPWNEPAPPVPSLPSLPTLPPPPPRPEHFATTAHSGEPVERVVEVRGTMSDGCPTARPAILEQIIEARGDLTEDLPTARRIEHSDPSSSSAPVAEPLSPRYDVVATEIVTDFDPEYAKKQQEAALSHLDRTELWLMAQKAYLSGVHFEEVKPVPETRPETVDIHIEDEPKAEEPEPVETSPAQKKKTVRFSEVVAKADIPRSLPPKLSNKESAYYRAFQDYVIRSRSQDAFVHRLPRFEALQAQRVSLRETHRNQLLGKYQLSVVPQSAKKRMSANVARGDDILVDDPEKIKREKEHEAINQMSMANWHVGATKALNGGRLFSAPIAKRLARLSRIGGAKNRARILDLGGQACDWAWHCALTYPNAKVYTVTTKAIRQLSNSNIRGPPNHRQVAVERLTRLPFPDNYFDLVSARELHSILKFIGENGADEWEACLAECLRVLKPGCGYLEFSLLDSDLVNAGPRGLAKSVEFGFALKTLGYDPAPTRMFLARLRRAGFADVRRAWTCLPMGEDQAAARRRNGPVARDSVTGLERPLVLEAMVSGSTQAAASVAGLAGSWAWERWLLRCETEKVACEGRLLETADMREAGKCLDGVHEVVEEGRRCGAGFRVLRGFARKPAQ
ncbi:hypothetical protein F5B20DRAFT_164922 [Whalleya microplaca]|nr:hypothetical protein F5B20DRAFT_164922 [Whalleya microplaca]